MLFSFKNFPTLKTKRLILKKATLNDVKVVFDLRSSKEINKFVGTKRIQNFKEANDFILLCDKLFKKKKRIFWLIQYKQEIIGSIVLHKISLDNNNAEIGYKLSPKYQHKGFMSEAMKRVLEFCFNIIKLKSIEAFTHKNNLASIALLKKYHFVFQPERRCDVFEFNRIWKLEN